MFADVADDKARLPFSLPLALAHPLALARPLTKKTAPVSNADKQNNLRQYGNSQL